jgi:ABC-type multidrug transport system fused ATPase/permease subunit
MLGILDLIGILMLGLLLTKATAELTGTGETSSFGNIEILKLTQELNLFQMAIITVFMFIGKSLFALTIMRYMAMKLAAIENGVAAKYFREYLQYPFLFNETLSKQDLNYSFTYSVSSATTKLLTVAVTILSESTLLVSIAVLFAIVDLKITLVICVYFGLIGIVMHRFVGSQYLKIGQDNSQAAMETFSTVEDSVSSFREISALQKEKEFELKFTVNRLLFAKANAQMEFLGSVPRYIVESALMVGALTLSAFTFRTSDNASAAGLLGVFLTGGLRIMASMLPLQNALGSIKQLTEQARPFFKLVNVSKPILKYDDSGNKFDNEPLEIAFKDVSYSYPNSQSKAISNVDFRIKPGELVAFIGPSGAGKSTIADLIIGIIEPSSGSVLINNKSSNFVMGYVPQAPGIVKGSIAENLTLNVFSKTSEIELINQAIDSAHLRTLVDSLDNGFNTDLGLNADSLSGGQLQRIGLARALYSNPKLLVLDEATSSLDAESESFISDTLQNLKGKCTTVVIAHRMATVQNADRVFVLENGQITASGKFSDLAKSSDLVARYIELSELTTD